MAELNARIIAKASATSGEAPLAGDLEVAEIAVNTADGKFFTKHTDGTVKEISGSGGGGGGAAIEGAISSESGYISWVYTAANTATPPAGQCAFYTPYPNSIFVSTETVEGDFETLLYAIVPNTSDATMFRNGFQVYQGPITAIANKSIGRMDMEFNLDQWFVSLEPGDIVSMYYEGWPASRDPFDGQVARYSAANTEWYASTDLSVQSVNGETGVISLGIQDMDDYEGAAGRSYTKTTDVSPQDPGQYYQITTSLSINSVDLNGESSADAFANATELWTSADNGVTWEYAQVGASTLAFGYYSWTINPDIFPAVRALLSGGSVLVSTVRPPADGDILQWNNADQKFKPTGDYISLTELKAEVAGSTDFTDFQSRIAAL